MEREARNDALQTRDRQTLGASEQAPPRPEERTPEGARVSKGRRGGGPKSAAGRARSARNAFRHGLSLPLLTDPAASAEVVALARRIAASAGSDPSNKAAPELLELAHLVAEAQFDLVRVRRARHDLIASALADGDVISPGRAAREAQLLEAAKSTVNRPGPNAQFARLVIAGLQKTPQSAEKLALTFVQLAQRLAAMDRYERLARSRRKFAIRDFDRERLSVA
jgi:hypothetical protein